jgi:hypothetical protein
MLKVGGDNNNYTKIDKKIKIGNCNAVIYEKQCCDLNSDIEELISKFRELDEKQRRDVINSFPKPQSILNAENQLKCKQMINDIHRTTSDLNSKSYTISQIDSMKDFTTDTINSSYVETKAPMNGTVVIAPVEFSESERDNNIPVDCLEFTFDEYKTNGPGYNRRYVEFYKNGEEIVNIYRNSMFAWMVYFPSSNDTEPYTIDLFVSVYIK